MGSAWAACGLGFVPALGARAWYCFLGLGLCLWFEILAWSAEVAFAEGTEDTEGTEGAEGIGDRADREEGLAVYWSPIPK